MDGLLAICRREGIDVEYVPLTRRKAVLGWYYRGRDGSPVIALDVSLPTNQILERCVLAEEVGHFYTSPVGALAGPHFATTLDRLNAPNRSRDEARGVKWAANYLIPTTALADAVKSGIYGVDELADYFNVTEWMVYRKRAVLRTDLKEQQGLRVKLRDMWAPILVDNLWGLSA